MWGEDERSDCLGCALPLVFIGALLLCGLFCCLDHTYVVDEFGQHHYIRRENLPWPESSWGPPAWDARKPTHPATANGPGNYPPGRRYGVPEPTANPNNPYWDK